MPPHGHSVKKKGTNENKKRLNKKETNILWGGVNSLPLATKVIQHYEIQKKTYN